MDRLFTIGHLSEVSHISIDTIRYYEKLGLLAPATRKSSGYRLYSEDTVQRLRFIKNAKSLGFTLKEIRGLLRLKYDPNDTACHEVRKKVEEKLNEINEKIKILQGMKMALGEMVISCKHNKKTDECPVLKSLDGLK
ncbi:MAG: heavy metal-responsive transcriptional regulator [Nitrospirae bacterium]|nr:heavy metal-responsive transcriptional regulator [Nitrospirota bacterium]